MKKKKLKGHKASPVSCVAWSADSKTLASGAPDGTIRFWNSEGKSIKVINTPDYDIACLVWAPDGTLTSLGEKKIRFWDTDGNQKQEIDADAYNILAWSPDAKMIASNTMDYKANIWHSDGSHIKELTGHTSYINGLGWSPDGAIFVTASEDAKIRLWNPQDWTETKVLSEYYESVTALAWAPDGQKFAVGAWTYSKKHVRIYDLEGKSVQMLEGGQDKIMALDWSQDGKWIMSGSSDKTILIFQPDGKLIEKIKVGKAVTDLAISPDNRALAVSCWDDQVYLYDLSVFSRSMKN
ncbi:MAG: WD40 repeat domain-containing protein [Candidatus Helarchaeota archaeon]